MGVSDTYDRNRRIPTQCKNGEKGWGNGTYRTSPKDNWYIQRRVNCADGEEMEYGYGSGVITMANVVILIIAVSVLRSK